MYAPISMADGELSLENESLKTTEKEELVDEKNEEVFSDVLKESGLKKAKTSESDTEKINERGVLKDVVTTFAKLKEAVENAKSGEETIIRVKGEIPFEDTITIPKGKKIIIYFDEKTVFKWKDDSPKVYIEVFEGGELSLIGGENKNIVFDGEAKKISNGYGYFLNIYGRFISDGVIFKNSKFNSHFEAPISVEGINAKAEIKNSIFEKNQGHNYGENGWWGEAQGEAGAIRVFGGADLDLIDSEIKNNEVGGGLGTGGIFISTRGVKKKQAISEVNIKNCTFTNNFGTFSGAFSAGKIFEPNRNHFAKINIEDSKFIGNFGYYQSGAMEINSMVEALIKNCEFQNNKTFGNGGGIVVYDQYVSGISSIKGKTIEYQERKAVNFEEYKKKNPIKVVIEKTLIKGNTASNCGGGLYVSSDGVDIRSAIIEKNKAGSQGGGVYVSAVPYTLRLDSALVENNIAKRLTNDHGFGAEFDVFEPVSEETREKVLKYINQENPAPEYTGLYKGIRKQGKIIVLENLSYLCDRNKSDTKYTGVYRIFKCGMGTGGGMWFCPTGDAEINTRNGLSLYKNSAFIEGDDFKSEIKGDGHKTVSLPNRTQYGRKVLWYKDDKNNRWNQDQEPIRDKIRGVDDSLSLKCVVEGDEKLDEEGEYNVVIKENQSSRGGGIGSNGNIIVGAAPVPENPLKDITISKEWKNVEDGDIKDVKMKAYIEINGEKKFVEEFIVTKDKGSYTIKDLPAKVGNRNIEDIIIIQEIECDQFDVNVEEAKASEELKKDKYGDLKKGYTIKVTNSKPKESTSDPEPEDPIEPGSPDGEETPSPEKPTIPDTLEKPKLPDTGDRPLPVKPKPEKPTILDTPEKQEHLDIVDSPLPVKNEPKKLETPSLKKKVSKEPLKAKVPVTGDEMNGELLIIIASVVAVVVAFRIRKRI